MHHIVITLDWESSRFTIPTSILNKNYFWLSDIHTVNFIIRIHIQIRRGFDRPKSSTSSAPVAVLRWKQSFLHLRRHLETGHSPALALILTLTLTLTPDLTLSHLLGQLAQASLPLDFELRQALPLASSNFIEVERNILHCLSSTAHLQSISFQPKAIIKSWFVESKTFLHGNQM